MIKFMVNVDIEEEFYPVMNGFEKFDEKGCDSS